MKKFIKTLLYILITILLIILISCILLYTPKKINTKYNDKDYDNFIEKLNLNKSNKKIFIDDLNKSKIIDKTPIEINNVKITAPEITAFLNNRIDKEIIYDINTVFDINTIIFTFKIGENLINLYQDEYKDIIPLLKGKQLYWDFTISNISKKLIISTNSLYVGSLRIPDQYVKDIIEKLNISLNNTLEKMETLKINNLNIDKDGITFTGFIPKEISFE